MLMRSYYKDGHGNFGPMNTCRHWPYSRVSKVQQSMQDSDIVQRVEDVKLAHVLSSKGWKVSPEYEGFRLMFEIEVTPAWKVKSVLLNSQIYDARGFNRNSDSTFVLNRSKGYDVFSDRPTNKIIIRTRNLKGDNQPLLFDIMFASPAESPAQDVLTLEDKIRMMEPDVLIKFSDTEKLSRLHLCVIRANSPVLENIIQYHLLREPGTPVCLTQYTSFIWLLAFQFMYSSNLDEVDDIAVIQELIELGDQFLVKDLMRVGVRRLTFFVKNHESSMTNVGAHLISMLEMTLYYRTRVTDSMEAEFQELKSQCEIYLYWHKNLIQCRQFAVAYGKYVAMLPESEEYENETTFPLLGKREWKDGDPMLPCRNAKRKHLSANDAEHDDV